MPRELRKYPITVRAEDNDFPGCDDVPVCEAWGQGCLEFTTRSTKKNIGEIVLADAGCTACELDFNGNSRQKRGKLHTDEDAASRLDEVRLALGIEVQGLIRRHQKQATSRES